MSSGGGSNFSSIMGLLSFGYWIYNLINPKKVEKPKPQELQVNNYSRTLPVPLNYGTNKYSGTVMCIGETGTEEIGSSGGKGGVLAGSQTVEGYNYYADFCIGLSEGVIKSVVELFYNDDPFTSIEDLSSRIYWRIYYGTSIQEIDPDLYSFFEEKSIPFKHTGYIFLSGSLGTVNSLPSIGGEIAGLLSYRGNDITSPFILEDWVMTCDENLVTLNTVWQNQSLAASELNIISYGRNGDEFYNYNGVTYFFHFNCYSGASLPSVYDELTVGIVSEYEVNTVIQVTNVVGNNIYFNTVSGDVLPSSGYLFFTVSKFYTNDMCFKFVLSGDGSYFTVSDTAVNTCYKLYQFCDNTYVFEIGDVLEYRISGTEINNDIRYDLTEDPSSDHTSPGYWKDGVYYYFWTIQTNWYPYNGKLYALGFYNDGWLITYGRWYQLRIYCVELDTGVVTHTDPEFFGNYTYGPGDPYIPDRHEFIHNPYSCPPLLIDSIGGMYYLGSNGFDQPLNPALNPMKYITNADFPNAHVPITINPLTMTSNNLIGGVWQLVYHHGITPIFTHFPNHKMFILWKYNRIDLALYRFTNGPDSVLIAESFGEQGVEDVDAFPYGFPQDGYMLEDELFTGHAINMSSKGVGVRICNENITNSFAECYTESLCGVDLQNLEGCEITQIRMDYKDGCFYVSCFLQTPRTSGGYSGFLSYQVFVTSREILTDDINIIENNFRFISSTPPKLFLDVNKTIDIETGLVLSSKMKFMYCLSFRKHIYSLGVAPGTGHDANPIEVLYDFLTNSRYGCGISTIMFDGDPYTESSGSWNTEYLFCQEEIYTDIGSRESRFLYSNVFLDKQKAFDIIQDILQTCRGFLYFCDGKIKVKIQKNNEDVVFYFGLHNEIFNSISSNSATIIYADFIDYPVGYWNGDLGICTIGTDLEVRFIIIDQTATFIEVEILDSFSPTDQVFTVFPDDSFSFNIIKDNIKKDSFQYSQKAVRETHNRIRLNYINRTDLYRTDIIEYDNNQNIDFTEEFRILDFDMPGIKRNTQARRMCLFLSDYDSQMIWKCSFQTDILGMFLCLGSIIGVTYEGLNWIGKLFRVISMEELEDFEVKVDLIEYIPTIFHDYAVPAQDINTSNLSNKYDVPDHVERLFLFEARDNNYIYVTFKRPDQTLNPFWSGADIYIKLGVSGTYTYLGRSSNYASSVKLDADLNSSDTTIYYDETTMFGAFSETGSIWIGEEEIYYGGLSIINSCFTDCVRGYNGTFASSHTSEDYCNLVELDFFKYKYAYEDIGKVLYFKAVSVTSFGIYASVGEAPYEIINLAGYFMLSYLIPYPVKDLTVTLI